MESSRLMSPGRSAPYSNTSTRGYAADVKTRFLTAEKITFGQKKKTGCSISALSLITESGKPISLLKFAGLDLTVLPLLNTTEIASFVEVLPTLPVTPTTLGRYREIVIRANSRKTYFRKSIQMLRIVSIKRFLQKILDSRLETIRRYLIIVENEFSQFTKRRHDSLPCKRRPQRLVQFNKYHESRIPCRRKTCITVNDLIFIIAPSG